MSLFASFDTPYRPIKPGLFQHDPARLLGSSCPACATRVFPSRPFCPHCHADEAPEPVVLSPGGSVFAFTVIHQAPAGRPTPYVLALVDLDDAVRVMAQIEGPVDAVKVGQRVSLVFKQVDVQEGVPVVGYAFAADTAEGSA